jgi:hypothetical protein
MLTDRTIAAIAEEVITQARHVIARFGSRAPGSPGERKAQEYMAECLAVADADEVCCEGFGVASRAFMRFQTVTGWLLIAAFAAYWVSPLPALLFSLMGLVVTWFQFVRYRLLLDPLCCTTASMNVLARWESTQETRRRIVLNAHMDAAYEWRFHYRWPRAFPWLVRYGLLGLPLMVLIDFVAVVLVFVAPHSGLLIGLGLVQVLLLPGFVLSLFFTDFNTTVPGANDNLSGVFIALGVAKALCAPGQRLAHTEIACLITGSEEAGLRGAKAWAARHAGELADCETVILTLDTLRDLEHLVVYDRDLNGTVRNDPAFSVLVQIAAKACGYDIPLASIPLGSTDAAAFTQAGLRATALCAMDPAPADFYHTRRDDVEAMDSGCIAAAIAVVAETIRQFDGGQMGR